MDTTKFLRIAAQSHKKWLAFTYYRNAKNNEDLIQDAYINLHQYIVRNPEKNYDETFINNIMFLSLSFAIKEQFKGYYLNIAEGSDVIDHLKKQPQNNLDIFLFQDTIADECTTYNHDLDSRIDFCLEQLNEMQRSNNDWFDAKLTSVYFNLDRANEKQLSMRELSKETKLGVITIFNSIKETKKKIQNKWQQRKQQKAQQRNK